MKWTAEQEQQLREMYEADTPASVIAKIMGRTVGAIYRRASVLGIGDPSRKQRAAKRTSSRQESFNLAYKLGMQSRDRIRAKSPPSGYSPAARAWWLAGWHDRDMELGVSVLEGAA